MAGLCIRYPEISAHRLILCEPIQGKANRGRRNLNYVDTLRKDTRLIKKKDIRTCMLDINVWRDLSNTDVRVEDQ